MTTTQNNDKYRAAAEALNALDATREHPRTDLGARLKREREAPVAHTPTPWIAESFEDGRYDVSNSRRLGVEIGGHPESNDGFPSAICYGPDREANARLIAAAPDLLAALKLCERALTPSRNAQDLIAADEARAAIARATTQA